MSEGFDRSDDDDAGGEARDFAVWTCDGVRFVGESAESKPEEYMSLYEEGEDWRGGLSVETDTTLPCKANF